MPRTIDFTPEELELVLEAARAGTWRLDLATGVVDRSASMLALLGLPADDDAATGPRLRDLVHPDDVDAVDAELERAAASSDAFAREIRVLWPDGSPHWIALSGNVTVDEDGRPVAIVGLARDVDDLHGVRAELRAAEAGTAGVEALLDAVYSAAPVGLAFFDRELRFVRVNDAMAAMSARPPAEHLGRRPTEVLGAGAAEAESLLRWVLEHDAPLQRQILAADDRTFEAAYYPLRGADGAVQGVGAVVTEITDRVAAGAERELLLSRARFIADISTALESSLDFDATLAALARLMVPRFADWVGIDMADGDGGVRSVAVAHVDPAKVALAQRLRERYPPDLDAPTGTPNVLRTGRPELYPTIPRELLRAGARDEEHLRLIESLDMTSAMAVPLRARGRTLGVLTLVRSGDHLSYTQDDLDFAGEIAYRAALAVDTARLYGEARDQERRTEEARALLDTLIARAPVGLAFFDEHLRYVLVNDALAEMNGVPAEAHRGRTTAELLPDLDAHVAEALRAVLLTGDPLVEAQVTGFTPAQPERVRHWLLSAFRVVVPGGDVLGVGATIVELTERVEAEHELRAQRDLYGALLRAQSELGEAFVLIEGGRPVYANEAAERITGYPAAELYAMGSLLELLPSTERTPVAERARRLLRGHVADPGFETRVRRRDGRVVPLEVAATALAAEDGGGRLVVIARDISERKAHEALHVRLLAEEQTARRASEAAHARVRLLADTSAVLEGSLSLGETLQRVAELLAARLSDGCAIDVLDRRGEVRRRGAAGPTREDGRALLAIGTPQRLRLSGDHPVALAIRERRTVMLDGPEAIPEPEAQAVWRRVGGHAAIVPLVARDRSLGTITLTWRGRETQRLAAREEWSLIEALAQRVALAVDNARQYQERTHIAQTLQASLLPKRLPTVPRLEIAAQYKAAGEGIEVGGDFYDVFDLGHDTWALVIGDVCGKGAEAAAVTALARYTLRAVTHRAIAPTATLETLNAEILRQMAEPRFLTAVLGHLTVHPAGGASLRVATGGHPAPVVVRADGTAEVVEVRGPLLGVVPDAAPNEAQAELSPGDLLVLFTDGIAEARRRAPLSSSALGELLAPMAGASAQRVAARVVAVAEERAGGPLRDDVAVLVVRLDES